MSDVIIHTRNLTKVYRLYASPRYRFLDMFGLLRHPAGAYTEHAALDGVSLDIRRGEKVAFIGRNGAGKSTLLKLLTGVIEPTAGVLDVKGKAHALLQIGSGFHPDFTGRENVYAYLAQLGVTGAEADRRFAEIVEFAELEEYIGQPVKTYSSGMAVRLMFSTSTAITPDLLVLDEVLGVGDAYFAHKSYGRIRELCDREGTTLLLVTHDVYSAVMICERVIWIDRGQVLMDGDGAVVVKAYEDSIRQQEEHRLRLRAQQGFEKVLAVAAVRHRVIVEIHSHGNEPQPSPVYFSRMVLMVNGSAVASAPLDGGTSQGAALQLEGSSWGEPVEWQGRAARALLNYGSPFHKVAAVFDLQGEAAAAVARGNWSVRCDFWSDQPCRLSVHGFVDATETLLGELPPSHAAWLSHDAERDSRAIDRASAVSVSGRQGTGDISIVSVAATAGGAERHVFRHGDPFELRVRYQIHSPTLRETAQVLVAFHRDGVQDVCRICARDLQFDAVAAPTGTITMRLPRLYLGAGAYTVTVMITEEGYYDRPQTVFYSINPGVYCSLSRIIEITVEGGGIVASGTAVVGTAEWTLTAGE